MFGVYSLYDCIGRQLKTWYRSGNASIAVAQFDDPQAHALQPYFLANLAPQGQARIVHGVYARYLAGKKNAVGVDPDRLKQSITQPLVLAEAAVERLERRA